MNGQDYIIFRSRFQPAFGKHHEWAVAELRAKFKGNSTILYGLVDDDLFRQDVCDRTLEILSRIYTEIGKEDDFNKYKTRFETWLNPSTPGEIQTSIYHSLNGHPAPIFFTPNMIISTFIIYDVRFSGKEYNVVSRYHLHTEPKSLKWFFPVFDKDDINDLGFIGLKLSITYGTEQNPYPDLEYIKFSRFNYYKEHQFVHQEENTYYGAYAATLVSSRSAVYFNERTTQLEGMTIPDIMDIPYVYLWGDLNRLTDKLIGIFSYYKENADDATPAERIIIERELQTFKNLKNALQRFTISYSKNLADFFKYCNRILSYEHKLKDSGLKQLRFFFDQLKLIIAVENPRCSTDCIFAENECKDCPRWLENSRTSQAKCAQILENLKKIVP